MTAHQQVPWLVEHKQRVVASRSQPLCTTRSAHATPTARFLETAGSHYIDRAWVKQMAQSRAERDIRLTTWASFQPQINRILDADVEIPSTHGRCTCAVSAAYKTVCPGMQRRGESFR